MLPAASRYARDYQRTRKHSLKELIGGTVMCIIVAAIFNVVFINALFFPDCNRITRDCFLIEKMWGQP